MKCIKPNDLVEYINNAGRVYIKTESGIYANFSGTITDEKIRIGNINRDEDKIKKSYCFKGISYIIMEIINYTSKKKHMRLF